MTTEPTDAEIIALADETRTGEPGRDGYILPISFARAVLQRWGQPSGAGEPLIRQLVESLEGYRRNHNDTQPCDAERAGRAWLEGKP